MNRTPLNIGQQPQLFFDNYIIEMVNYVTRTMHSPSKLGENPILKKDQPWEKVLLIRTSTWNVHWDEKENLYKCWYMDLGWDFEAFMGRNSSMHGKVPPGLHESSDHRTLYAESEDGIHWQKPELDYRRIDGQKTNICLGNEEIGKVHCCTVLPDPFESDEEKRFKAIFYNWPPPEKMGGAGARIAAAYSPDGRVWTPYDQPVVIGEISELPLGDVIILTADRATGEYHLDTRVVGMSERLANPKLPLTGWDQALYPDDPWRMIKRRIFSTNSYNILQWPGLHEMLVPDEVADNIDDEFYGLVRFRIGDLLIGLLNVFHRTENTLNIHLVYSRDGFNWQHAGQRRPFLDLGSEQEGAWDRYMVETCTQPLFLDDETRIYYGGSSYHHDWWMVGAKEGLDHPEAKLGPKAGESALGLATLRPEGFVSLDSMVRDGILSTRPFVSDGNKLVVNVACQPKGYFEAELTDVNDDVIAGYERKACDTFQGDATKHVVTWQGQSQLPQEVLQQGAKLRFFSRHASFYSFRIADDQKQ